MATCSLCGSARPEGANGPCKLTPDGTAYSHEGSATHLAKVRVDKASELEAEEQPAMVPASYEAYGQPAEPTREEDAELTPAEAPKSKAKAKAKR
jgi:hypothetical protein